MKSIARGDDQSIILFGCRIRLPDIAAVMMFLLLFGWFLATARLGVNATEESFYISLGDRFVRGDRPIVNEWHLTQFTGFMYYIPVWLHNLLFGGSEGIVLFIRYLCIGAGMGVYWFLYAHLRAFGWSGLAGLCAYFLFLSVLGFTFYYYNVAMNGSAVVCTVLFLSKRSRSPFVLAFTGIVLACVVLAEPLFALLYILYCIVVLRCAVAGKSDFTRRFPAFSPRGWILLTAGVVAAAIPVTALLLKGGVRDIANAIPYLLGDSEYGSVLGRLGSCCIKLFILFQYYGIVNAAAWVLLLAATAVFCRYRRKNGRGAAEAPVKKDRKTAAAEAVIHQRTAAFARGLFITAVCLLIATYVWGMRSFIENLHMTENAELYFYHFYHTAPFSAFVLVCFLLSEKKDVRLFAFWLVAFIEGALVLYSSKVVCSVCGVTAYPAGLIVANDVRRQLFCGKAAAPVRQKRLYGGRLKQGATALCCAALCAFFCFEGCSLFINGYYTPIEKYMSGRDDLPLSETITRGPYKGVRTNSEVMRLYNASLDDLDVIAADCTGPVCVLGRAPHFYLYLSLPYGTYCTFFQEEDFMMQHINYWRLLPGRAPAYFYIPFYSAEDYKPIPIRRTEPLDEDAPCYTAEEKLNYVKGLCECTVTESDSGYIVKVLEWRGPDA